MSWNQIKKTHVAAAAVVLFLLGAGYSHYARTRRVGLRDFATFFTEGRPVGVATGDNLARLHVSPSDLHEGAQSGGVRYLGPTEYLNHMRAVVTHTVDDSSDSLPASIDAMDKYGIKATIFVSTEVSPIASLWPRLEEGVRNGHEIGSHSRRHQCQWPDTLPFCFRAFGDEEVTGSRDDILRHTTQPHVWSFGYPCGNCNTFEFVHRKLARAGYLVARNYPDELHDGQILPDLQTYDKDPYNATYTQAVQKRGGIARTGRTDVAAVNGKFDEVYAHGGIYNFLSHPELLDYGPDKFYEQHLSHVGNHADIWYVPMGPLYAYHSVHENTTVKALDPGPARARFAVYHNLDPKIFPNCITLQFTGPSFSQVRSGGVAVSERHAGMTDRWDEEYYRREGDTVYLTIRPNTIVEFL
jgi:peptidoglycan/xylan/chitin deacetylase (PgdA/CDA1 family)